ncbi:hypothetical protein [Luteitalea sp.]|uniref:hypothetical protein n=1 Tax=Luteitalea sp. TaxID=2004800 RepID=UPI0025C69C51|nr:hypothetical protein [Luteitalea sp.]
MKRPPSHPTLPFEDTAADDQTPLEVTIRVAQPSLLGTQAALETDVVHAIEAADWRASLDLLARLRQAATAAQADSIDEAAPTLSALASNAPDSIEHAGTLIGDIAAKAPTNVWLRHVTATLVRLALAHDGTDGLAARLDAGAFPHVYRVMTASDSDRSASGPFQHPGQGHLLARALLRDALVRGLPISLDALGDRELDVLDASGLSPAWYPVLGAQERLWDVPRDRPSTAEVSAVLDTPVPDDDSARARLFWQAYRAWKAQRQPNDIVARTRAAMKQLHPELFARLG